MVGRASFRLLVLSGRSLRVLAFFVWFVRVFSIFLIDSFNLVTDPYIDNVFPRIVEGRTCIPRRHTVFVSTRKCVDYQ